MLKPNGNELCRALDAAKYMREHDVDHHCVAKTLLYFAERNEKLEKVMSAAELYLHSGQGSAERAELALAITRAKRGKVTTECLLPPHPQTTAHSAL